MRACSRRFVLVSALFLSLGIAASQSEPTISDSADRPSHTIRVSTRLVQVSVIVEDRNGAPIKDLRKESFRVLDDGIPQEVAFVSAPLAARVAPYPLPANSFTNRSDLQGQDPRATIVILFDALNTSFEDQAYARQKILRFLQSVKPQDHVAIFALTTQLVALHDFTEDAASLAGSVDRFSPRLLAAFDASHPENFHVPALAGDPSWTSFENHVNNANGEIADSRVIDRFQTTYAAMVEIADYVANIPGHKSLVWVSGGIPIQLGGGRIGTPDRDTLRFDSSEALGESNLNSLTRALNRANMAIYPIDAHGVETDDSAAGFYRRQDQRDSFRLLADDTGGKAFYGTNDLEGAMQSAFEDDRYTYTLGFYPNHGTWDGKFREIKISLPLSGARLRYRRGYFAFPERMENEAIMRADLQEAARSPLDATALGLTVSGKRLASSASHLLQLDLSLDPKQFLLRTQKNRREGGLDLLFLQKDSEGKILVAEKQHFDINFEPKEYDSLAKSGLILQRKVAINPASAQIRVLVRDAGSGELGSVTFPLKQFF
jgi:VWFA-related protein